MAWPDATIDGVTGLHLSDLHLYEQALTLILAFGPFVVLALVILIRRRQDPPT